MTSTNSLLGFSVSSFVALLADGTIDQATSVANFMKAAEDAVQEQNDNRTAITAILAKYSTEYVTTDDVIGRCISQYERKNDLDLSPSDRKVKQESLDGTIESLKTSGFLFAKIGKGGGLQTTENHLRIVEAVEAKKNAKKLPAKGIGRLERASPFFYVWHHLIARAMPSLFPKLIGTGIAGRFGMSCAIN